MKAEIKTTGEILEFNPKSLKEIQEVWQMANEYIKAYTAIKDQLKPLVEAHVNHNGVSEPVNGYQFRVSNVQRYNYDKAVLRQNLDEDTVDLLLVPDKTAIDKYLKENLEELGDVSTELRNSMVPVGKPYSVVKAEKITSGEI